MADFLKLKEICAKKVDEATKLETILKTALIRRDLSILADKMPERLIKTDGKYVLDEKITISIDGSGNLNIVDDRATAFYWLFEVEFLESLFVGDIFEHDGKVYKVSYLNGNEYIGVCTDTQNIIDNIDKSIVKMKEKTNLDMWSYQFYDCNGDKRFDSLDGVVSVVVDRNPIFR